VKEEEGELIVQTLRKVWEEEAGDFLAQTRRTVEGMRETS
jgi:hypothetical protein